jgi:hypothetical protein
MLRASTGLDTRYGCMNSVPEYTVTGGRIAKEQASTVRGHRQIDGLNSFDVISTIPTYLREVLRRPVS